MRTLVRSARPSFLVLTPASVALGCASALQARGHISLPDAGLVLCAALLAHVSVNALNEYQDFCSGLDARTEKTPFSGGSGALIEDPQGAGGVRLLALASLAAVLLIGLYFLLRLGLALLPLGVAGVALILGYTRWLNRNPWTCLLAPGIGFGPLMVLGTHFVLAGGYSLQAAWLSLLPLFLASNLLLLNQLPDIDADRGAGRRHLAIVYGRQATVIGYAVLSCAAALSIVVGIWLGLLPAAGLFSLLALALALPVLFGIRNNLDSVPGLLPYLGLNVIVVLLTPVLLAGSIMLAVSG